MRALRIILMALAFVAFHAHAAQRNLTVTASNAQEQKRIALVIGNAAYQSTSPLRNPVNDAHAMADALNKLGFQVIEVTDASQKEMNRAIAEFGSKLNAETAALFFYAGHGLQVKNKNYLVPVDAQINGEAAVRAETVDVDTVMDQLNVSSLSIVILDACRNNPFERSFRKMGGGLAQMDAPKGSFVAYATAPGKTAADGDGKNGLFTQELLKQINTPGLSLEGVFKRVRANVSKTTGDTQMPWDSSSMTGDFYFKPGDGTSVASLVPVPAQPARIKTKEEIEDGTWNTAEAADTAEAINAYLSGYPKGRYVTQAKVKLASLKKQAQQPAHAPVATGTGGREDAETLLWGEAQKGNSKEDYQAYLDQYPKGKYIALAKSRIKKLQDEAAAEAVRKEQQAWQTAEQAGNEAYYQTYLKGYPQGSYAALAQVRIRKLQSDLTARQEAELWNKADSSNDKAAVETYLNRYPSGRYVAAASAKLQAIREEEAKGPAMVRIPGKNYELGKYEVTQKEWRDVMGSNPPELKFTSCGDTCPVERVSWNDVQEFLQKLNAKTGRQYRLPSEAEWEYACYGGSQTEYCGSNAINAVAWYGTGADSVSTHPSGQKQANGYGLYDMSGNVWEWMENKYDNEYDWRVLRGGSWGYSPNFARSALRKGENPVNRLSDIGFRVARTLP